LFFGVALKTGRGRSILKSRVVNQDGDTSMSVETILKSKGNAAYTIRPEHSVSDAAALMSTKRVGVAMVCDAKGKLQGMVSERDIVHGITQYGKGLLDMPVRNIMSSPVVTCHPGDTVKTIMEIMTNRRVRHLPVVDGVDILGIISIGDVVSYRLRESEAERAVLRDYAVTR